MESILTNIIKAVLTNLCIMSAMAQVEIIMWDLMREGIAPLSDGGIKQNTTSGIR